MALFVWGCKGPLAPVDTGSAVPPRGELLGIGLAPRDPLARVGDQVPFFATAYYDNTEYEDITAQVRWVTADERVATIGADGVAFAVGPGTTEIVAEEASGTSSSVTLTVLASASVLLEVEISPASVSVREGESFQLAAMGTYSDGSAGNVGAGCTWSSAEPAVATVDAVGLVVGQQAGVSNISAVCEAGLSSSATVDVVAADIDLGQAELAFSSVEGIGIDSDVLWIVEVTNYGDAYAGGFFVDAFLDPGGPPVPGDAYDASGFVSGLAPGESTEVFIELYDAPFGSWFSWLGLDFDNLVEELDEGNNIAGPVAIETSAAALGPDLEIVEAFAITDGAITEYLVEIANSGDQVALDFWVDLYTDRPDAPGVCSLGDSFVNITELGPGESFVWDPVVSNAAAPGAWNSWVYVDSCDDLDESDESDNQLNFSPI